MVKPQSDDDAACGDGGEVNVTALVIIIRRVFFWHFDVNDLSSLNTVFHVFHPHMDI